MEEYRVIYFGFSSVSVQDLFETWNYVDRCYLNLHRDEVLQPRNFTLEFRTDRDNRNSLLGCLGWNVVVLIHSFDLLDSLDPLLHRPLHLHLPLCYCNPDHPLLLLHQSELEFNGYFLSYYHLILPLEIFNLLPSSSPSKSRYCSFNNFNCCSSSLALIFLIDRFFLVMLISNVRLTDEL